MEIARSADGFGREIGVSASLRSVTVKVTPRPDSAGLTPASIDLDPEQALVIAKALEMGARKVRDRSV